MPALVMPHQLMLVKYMLYRMESVRYFYIMVYQRAPLALGPRPLHPLSATLLTTFCSFKKNLVFLFSKRIVFVFFEAGQQGEREVPLSRAAPETVLS
jgi:hypothetical protein